MNMISMAPIDSGGKTIGLPFCQQVFEQGLLLGDSSTYPVKYIEEQ